MQDIQTLIPSNKTNKKLNIEAKCSQNHESILSCNNPNCNEYAFVCNNKLCECRQNHKKCLFTCTDQVLELIQSKRSQSNDVLDKACEVLEKWIDEISKTRQRIQFILCDWGLSGAQKKFISLIKKQQYKSLTGKHINQITTSTVSYFSQQTKQTLFRQIQNTGKNYNSEIQHVLKTFQSLFDKIKIQEKQQMFNNDKLLEGEVEILKDYHFLSDFDNFKQQQKKLQSQSKNYKHKREDFDRFTSFVKNAVQKDFKTRFNKYRNDRRKFGTSKLRQKYFEDYIYNLTKLEVYLTQWKQQTEQKIKHLSKCLEPQLKSLSIYWRQFQSQIEKPFTLQMALSYHKAINVLYSLTQFVKQNGKEMYKALCDKNKNINEQMVLAIYFLDGLMDKHPEICQVDVIWNVVRYEDKLKAEMNFLFQTISQAIKDPYSLEIQIANV